MLTSFDQVAQSYGLFYISNHDASDAVFGRTKDIETRWQAWSRLESAKR